MEFQARRKLFVIGGLKPRAEGPSRALLARVLQGGGGGPGACSHGKFLNQESVKCHFMVFGGKI